QFRLVPLAKALAKAMSASPPSQLINSIDILRARRATGLMTRNNYRMVNNITQGKHPEAKR
ncbi:TA system toxin CbtA family protein, partial [Escherichia coli]|uniref:TA system toxin CbtA family protein n=1 Tax=Escherichia coli TaxID=562 RepID=UPI00200CCD10